MGIKHRATKQKGEKGFASEWNDDHVIDGDVDLNNKQIKNVVIDNKETTPTEAIEGKLFYNTTTKRLLYYDGTGWGFKLPDNTITRDMIKDGEVTKEKLSSEVKSLRSSTIIIAAYNSKDKTKADYVCTGSGDHTIINNAINSCVTGGSNGGRVLLLEGDYYLSDRLILKNNVILEGQGEATILNISKKYGVTVGGVSNAVIKNLKINFYSSSEGDMDIEISGANNVKFINVHFIHSNGYANTLFFTYSGGEARNCVFDGCIFEVTGGDCYYIFAGNYNRMFFINCETSMEFFIDEIGYLKNSFIIGNHIGNILLQPESGSYSSCNAIIGNFLNNTIVFAQRANNNTCIGNITDNAIVNNGSGNQIGYNVVY